MDRLRARGVVIQHNECRTRLRQALAETRACAGDFEGRQLAGEEFIELDAFHLWGNIKVSAHVFYSGYAGTIKTTDSGLLVS
jgi:hypothetical protein